MTQDTNTASGAADLIAAAKSVVDRWDTPLWKDVPATAEYIGRLRAALASAAAPAQQPTPSAAEATHNVVDWSSVGLLLDAHATTRQFVTGTSNWAAAICRYMADHSAQPSPTPQADSQPAAPIDPAIAADLERSDWTPAEALRWYASGKHYDTVPNGDGSSSARILDNGAVASNALKSLSREYAEHKGDVALTAPQADSQPAPVAAFEVADAMADSQYLAGVSAGWNAANADDPNAALQKLHESRAGYLKPLSASRAPATHGDDVAVDVLSGLMKAKLAKQRSKGYGGWDSTECTQQHLSNLLRAHVDKGDPVDVANFCAFLSARGEGIAPQADSQPAPVRGKLLPCPCCGGEAAEHDRLNSNTVRCLSCGLRVKQSEMGMGDAAKRWNSRAARAPEDSQPASVADYTPLPAAVGVAHFSENELISANSLRFQAEHNDDGVFDECNVELFTADQMRAFADATHALRASRGQAPAGAMAELAEYESPEGDPHPILSALSEHDDPCEDTADALTRIAALRAEIDHLRPFFLRAQAQDEAETERLAAQHWQEQAARTCPKCGELKGALCPTPGLPPMHCMGCGHDWTLSHTGASK